MIPLRGEIPPLYQQDAIQWLQHFRNTELLQQLLARFQFSDAEVAAYRSRWRRWLRLKPDLRHISEKTL